MNPDRTLRLQQHRALCSYMLSLLVLVLTSNSRQRDSLHICRMQYRALKELLSHMSKTTCRG